MYPTHCTHVTYALKEDRFSHNMNTHSLNREQNTDHSAVGTNKLQHHTG